MNKKELVVVPILSPNKKIPCCRFGVGKALVWAYTLGI
jgi:hypothetical protein